MWIHEGHLWVLREGIHRVIRKGMLVITNLYMTLSVVTYSFPIDTTRYSSVNPIDTLDIVVYYLFTLLVILYIRRVAIISVSHMKLRVSPNYQKLTTSKKQCIMRVFNNFL